MDRLLDRTIIVTGGAQGIGAAYARALASEGASVALSDVLDCAPVVDAIRKAGGLAIASACDITDPDAVARLVDVTMSAFGRVDGLVNNAALFSTLALTPLEQISSADFDKVMAVNVRGTFEMIKAVLPVMRQQRYGKIVNIASGTVFKGAPFLLPYVSSKGAIIAMTRSVAREAGSDGICVNCVAPGFTLSESVSANPGYAGAIPADNRRSRCLGRDQVPDDLTGVVTFLLSSDSDFITGQTIVVDGGSVMH